MKKFWHDLGVGAILTIVVPLFFAIAICLLVAPLIAFDLGGWAFCIPVTIICFLAISYAVGIYWRHQ